MPVFVLEPPAQYNHSSLQWVGPRRTGNKMSHARAPSPNATALQHSVAIGHDARIANLSSLMTHTCHARFKIAATQLDLRTPFRAGARVLSRAKQNAWSRPFQVWHRPSW